MTWEYRLVRVGEEIGIFEVYYDEKGQPTAYCDAAVVSSEGVDGLIKLLVLMGKAAEKPVLVFMLGESDGTGCN